MDNKRVYKKISSIFWFMLATFPIWFCLFGSIFQLLSFYGTDLGENALSNLDMFTRSFRQNYDALIFDNDFYSFCPSFLTTMFYNLFEYVGIDANILDNISIEIIPSWFCWVYFLELMVDFIIWLPQWFHKILEKGFDKLS